MLTIKHIGRNGSEDIDEAARVRCVPPQVKVPVDLSYDDRSIEYERPSGERITIDLGTVQIFNENGLLVSEYRLGNKLQVQDFQKVDWPKRSVPSVAIPA
jgi:hypothetical protein